MSEYINVLPKLLDQVSAMDESKIVLLTVCAVVLIGVWKLPEVIRAVKDTKDK